MSTLRESVISRSAFLKSVLKTAPCFWAACALVPKSLKAAEAKIEDPASRNLGKFIEMARSDLRTEKALYIAENLHLTNDEAIDFWPLHREYELESNKLLDERTAVISQFVTNYDNMTDPKATELAQRSFDLELKRAALKRAYFKKFTKVISPLKAARFFQMENQIDTAMELQVASRLPLIK